MAGHVPRSDIEGHNPGKIRGMAVLADELLMVLGTPSPQEPAAPFPAMPRCPNSNASAKSPSRQRSPAGFSSKNQRAAATRINAA
jgi:hypothetical protein